VGIGFESAFTASEAMTALNGSNFDFVLVDMKLPDRSGAELIAELNEKDDGPLDFKLFLCTANPLINKQHPETLEEVDGLLLKPFKEFEIAKLLAGDQSLLNSSPQESMKLDYTLDNFRKFAGFDQQILRKFIESFIKTNKQNLELLHQYHEDEDLYALADIAHKMKNTYGQLEAERIVKRLVVLENPLEKLSEKQRKQTVSEIKDLSAKLFTGLEKDLSEMD
jgi:CheY-like chemotaxis protein